MPAKADRNLLFGLLAHQMQLVDRRQLIAGLEAWVREPNLPLGEFLCRRQAISAEEREIIERGMERYLARHHGDPRQCLAAIPFPADLRDELARFADAELLATLPPDATLARALRTLPPAASEASTSGADSLPLGTLPHTPNDKTAPDIPDLETAGAARKFGAGPTRYQPIRPHARGGLGELFVATDTELEREVALKEIQERWAGDAGARQRFVLEAKVTGGLEHPGIVPVYGLGVYPDGRPYYAMRFIRGESLQKNIDEFHAADRAGERSDGERQIALRQLLNRYVAVCQAIHYAHSRGVLHRDLKPENVMVGGFGETLVVDWGLAKLVGRSEEDKASGEATLRPSSGSSSQTQMGTAVGTPRYMSPEQALGWHDSLTPATDVYSLGAMLYTLLTGRAAIEGNSVAEILLKVQTGNFPKPTSVNSRVPASLEAIILQAMALKAGERYPSARALADDIEAYLADEPVSAWQEPWTEKARRWIGRHQTLVTGIAAAISVALVALIVGTSLLAAANQQVSDALAETQKEWKRAESEKKKAEDNFALARSVVDDFHLKVSDDPRLKSKGLEQLRHSLLQTARKFYDKFAGHRSDDPRIRLGQARTYMRLASSTGDIASRRQALADYQTAAKLLADLQGANDAVVGWLIECQAEIGRLHSQLGDPAAAEKVLSEALANAPAGDRAKLAPTQRIFLARCAFSLGDIHFAQGEYAAAHLFLEQAHQEQELLQRQALGTESDLARLIETRNALGNLFADTSKFVEAEQQYASIIAACDKEIQGGSDSPDFVFSLANAYHNRGTLRQSLGLYQKAEQDLRASVTLKTRLATDHPEVYLYQFSLAQVRLHRADLLRDLGQHNEARQLYDQARAALSKLTQAREEVPALKEELIVSHFRLGEVFARDGQSAEAEREFQTALRMAKELVATYRDVQSHLSLLVDAHALLAGHYAGQPGEEARHKSLDAYGAAIRLLNQLSDRYPNWLSYAERSFTLLDSLAMQQYHAREYPLARSSLEAVQRWLRAVIPKYPTRFSLYRHMTIVQRHLAVIDASLGETARAEQGFASAAEVESGFARTFSQYPRFGFELGVTHLDAAQAWSLAGRHDAAEASLQQAAPIFSGLVERQPQAILYRDHWVATCRLGHDVALALGKPELALSRCDRAIAFLRPRWEAGETDGVLRTSLAAAYANRARRLVQLGRAKEGVEAWDQVGPLHGTPLPLGVALERATAIARAGDPRAAVREVIVARVAENAPGENWGAALVYGYAIESLAADPLINDADRGALRKTYLAAAQQHLARAKAAGYFATDSGRVTLIAQGNEPASLREELDRLRKELKSPDD